MTAGSSNDRGERMIRRVEIQGYKSLRDVEIHLQPLTVLKSQVTPQLPSHKCERGYYKRILHQAMSPFVHKELD
jgi:hypothetical protein